MLHILEDLCNVFYLLFILFHIFSVLFFTVAHYWTKFWTSLSKRFPYHFHELITTLRKCISSFNSGITATEIKFHLSSYGPLSYSPHTLLDSINLSGFVWVFSCLCCWGTPIFSTELWFLEWKYYSGIWKHDSGGVLLYNYCYLCYCYVVTFLACHCYFAIAPPVLRAPLTEVPNRTHPFKCIW